MWTAHVVQGGVAALDPLDGIQQPREPGTSRGVNAPAPGPAVGHGTQALQEMAAARPKLPPRRSLQLTSEPRITTMGAVGVFVGALLLFGIGVYFFRQGTFTVQAPPSQVSRPVTLRQPEYQVTLPSSWPARTTSGTPFDAVYAVPDQEVLDVAVVDVADQSISDPNLRDERLAVASDSLAAAIGSNPVLVTRTIVRDGHTTFRVATYDVTDASGTVTRVRAYLTVGLDRAVIVVAYGTPGAVNRHLDEVVEVARTARLKP